MNLWRKIKRRNSRMVDATDLIQTSIAESKNWTDEERQDFLDSIKEGFRRSGEYFMKRAISEGVLTEKKLKEWGLEPIDIQPVLHCYFAKIDGNIKEGEDVKVVTTEGSKLFNKREKIQEFFDIIIINVKEGLVELEKEKAEKEN